MVKYIKQSIKTDLKNVILEKNKINIELLKLEKKIETAIELIHKKLSQGGKIFLCGNGGSAADAQHLAAECLVRLRPKINRKPIPAISLAMDSSTFTACGNDYNFKYIFSRNLEALSNYGKDILIAISTSGNSKNIIEAIKIAKKKKIISIGFLGNNGGKILRYLDIPIVVNNTNTARIQECHIFIGHFIIEAVEDRIIKNKKS